MGTRRVQKLRLPLSWWQEGPRGIIQPPAEDFESFRLENPLLSRFVFDGNRHEISLKEERMVFV